MAAWHGNHALVELLLESSASPDKHCDDGVTPLFTASQEGHLAIVERLCEAGASWEATVVGDRTPPLFMAAQRGHLAVVEYLCKARADMEAVTQEGTTPLNIASCASHLDIVKHLCQLGVGKSRATK